MRPCAAWTAAMGSAGSGDTAGCALPAARGLPRPRVRRHGGAALCAHRACPGRAHRHTHHDHGRGHPGGCRDAICMAREQRGDHVARRDRNVCPLTRPGGPLSPFRCRGRGSESGNMRCHSLASSSSFCSRRTICARVSRTRFTRSGTGTSSISPRKRSSPARA